MSNRIKQKRLLERQRAYVSNLEQAAILVNPFVQVASPKLRDGKRDYTAGIKLRQTGELRLNTDSPTYIGLIPGFSSSVFFTTNDGKYSVPFNGHVENDANRNMIDLCRLVSVGLRLQMVNNADQDEGYWEAARVTVYPNDFIVWTGALLQYKPTRKVGEGESAVWPDIDLSNYPSYQTGKIKDLQQMQFKLNSTEIDHDFTPIRDGLTPQQLVDEQFDMVLIKLQGRKQEQAPTVIMYDTVSIQEVVYAPGSPLARLMTNTERADQLSSLLQKSSIKLPASKK